MNMTPRIWRDDELSEPPRTLTVPEGDITIRVMVGGPHIRHNTGLRFEEVIEALLAVDWLDEYRVEGQTSWGYSQSFEHDGFEYFYFHPTVPFPCGCC